MYSVDEVKGMCARSKMVNGRDGILVKGSKQLLADEIVACLPPAKVFIDCFGGGASVAMAALRSGKYERVVYNEKAPILYNCVNNTLNGDYYGTFVPFVGFEDYKTTEDPRQKICFSFNGLWWSYGYRKSHEDMVHALHDYILDKDEWVFDVLPEIAEHIRATEVLRDEVWRHITTLSRIVCHYMGVNGEFGSYNGHSGNFRLVHLLRQKSLNNMRETILKHGEVFCTNLDYREYRALGLVSDKDVLYYCDPPYKSVTGYQSSKGIPFDYDEFLDWCKSGGKRVYISERAELPFEVVWSKKKNAGVTTVDRRVATELLYKV